MSKLPATMHAVEIKEFGPAEGLVLAERPVPIPNDGEVLIRVSYAGVNRPDVQQRLGGYDHGIVNDNDHRCKTANWC